MARVRLLPFAFLVPVVALVGCSKSNSLVPARVTGSITYKGQPVKGGRLTFYTAEKVPYDGQISSDGTYTATDLPEGPMTVTIDTEPLKPQAVKGKVANRRAGMMQQPAPGAETPEHFYVKIPAKYAKIETTTLNVTLVRGKQEHNFELTD